MYRLYLTLDILGSLYWYLLSIFLYIGIVSLTRAHRGGNPGVVNRELLHTYRRVTRIIHALAGLVDRDASLSRLIGKHPTDINWVEAAHLAAIFAGHIDPATL